VRMIGVLRIGAMSPPLVGEGRGAQMRMALPAMESPRMRAAVKFKNH
jgi:hypothetical protein